MSETNGQNDKSKLDRVEESHVKLMADQDVLWARHLEFVAEQDRQRALDREEEREYRKQQRERDAARDAVTDKRIADLVSAMGKFIADKGGKAA